MRVLFASSAWPTHFFTAAPLAWAFRSAGHEVRVAAAPFMSKVIAGAGLPAVPFGTDVDFVDIRRRSLRFEADRDPGAATGDDLSEGGRRHQEALFDAWREATTAGLEELIDVARDWQPGLIVSDVMCPGGVVAAQLLGVPGIRHLLAPDILGSTEGEKVLHLLPGFYEPYERVGLSVTGDPAVRTVDPCPPSMQPPAAPGRMQMQYVPFNGSGVLGAPLPAKRGGRPRVCVTFGHSVTQIVGEEAFLVPRVVKVLAGLGAEVLVVVNASQRAMLGELPEGVRVLESAPLHMVVDSCDLVVHQGGAGSTLTAARYGVPQLAITQLPDQRHAAGALVNTGAGIQLEGAAADEQAIRSHVETLLGPKYRRAADELRAEILSQPSPAEVAESLLALAR